MTAEIILQPSADAIALQDKRAELVAARASLAEREAEVAQLRAQLAAFELRYMRQVGVLYAELDGIEARITEREVALYDSDAARERAEEARRRAEESHEAAFGAETPQEEFEPPPTLKALFREVAKRIHPDFARDEAEREYFHLLMARANQAYRRGHTDVLQRLLDDQLEVHASAAGESLQAELLRTARQIQHAKRETARLEVERDALLAGDLAHLHADAEAAAREHRDLLAELASSVREQIAEAQRRWEVVDRQITAHGK
jgi:hypothetical protein